MSSATKRIRQSTWEQHKDKIIELHYNKHESLKNVMDIMRNEHELDATRAQWERQLRKWHSRKNLRMDDWKLIFGVEQQLQRHNPSAKLRVTAWGNLLSEAHLNRGRSYLNRKSDGSVLPTNLLSSPKYSHITIEVQATSGEWSKFPSSASDEPSGPAALYALHADISSTPPMRENSHLLGDQSESAVRPPSPTIDWLLDETDIASLILPLQQTPEPVLEWSLPQGGLTQDTTNGDYQLDDTDDCLTDMGLDLLPRSHWQGVTMLGTLGGISLGFMFPPYERTGSSYGLAVVPDISCIRQTLMLMYSVAAKSAKHRLSKDDLPFTDIEIPPGYLQFYLSSATRRMVPDSWNDYAQQTFLDILEHTVRNKLSHFGRFPVETMLYIVRTQPLVGQKLFARLRALSGPRLHALADNLFRAAANACDVAAMEAIYQELKNQAYSLQPDKMVNPSGKSLLDSAISKRNLKTLRFLLGLGVNLPKNALIHAVCQKATPHRPYYTRIDLEFVQELLTAGASMPALYLRQLASNSDDSALQSTIFSHISADIHYECARWLSDMIENLDEESSLVLARRLVSLCKEANCTKCSSHRPLGFYSSSLIKAATRNFILLCEFLLESHHQPPGALFTALSRAIRVGNRQMADLLIRHGANVQDSCDQLEHYRFEINTPLSETIRARDEYFSDLMKRLGALNSLQNAYHRDAAILASAEIGDTSMLKTLLMANKPTKFASTLDQACIEAVKNDSREAVDMLLSAGALLDSVDAWAASLSAAIAQRNSSIVDLILDIPTTSVSKTDLTSNLKSMKNLAATCGALVEWGTSTALKQYISRQYPLDDHLVAAVLKKDKHVSNLLLDSGANINTKSKSGVSPLGAAVQSADEGMVTYLLQRDADPADSNAFLVAVEKQRGLLAMLAAAFQTKYPRGRKRFGADIFIKSIELEDMQLLKRCKLIGMDIDSYSETHNCTALGYALVSQTGSDLECIRTVLQQQPCIDAIVLQNEHCRPGRILKWPSFPRENMTALLAAIWRRHLGAVNLLLDAGADINRPAEGGIKWTPLQAACERGDYRIVKLLLERGANVHAPPPLHGGGSALYLACQSKSMGIVELLLAYGAAVIHDPMIEMFRGSVLEVAAAQGHFDLLTYLWCACLRKHGVRFSSEAIQRAKEVAKQEGHLACAEHIEQLEAYPDWHFYHVDLLTSGNDGWEDDLNLGLY